MSVFSTTYKWYHEIVVSFLFFGSDVALVMMSARSSKTLTKTSKDNLTPGQGNDMAVDMFAMKALGPESDLLPEPTYKASCHSMHL